MRVLIVVLFVVSSCSAFSLQRFLLADDGSALVDSIVNKIKAQTPSWLYIPDFNLDLVDPKSSVDNKLGSLKASNGWLHDLTSFQRTTPVVAVPSLGNLTLSTTFSFWDLGLQYRLNVEILGTETNSQLNVTFDQNEFELVQTIYTDPSTGGCAVDLKKAAFTRLKGIALNGKPLGYFHQITFNAYINHITQTVLNKLPLKSIINIQEIAESVVCKDSSSDLSPTREPNV